jgi:hypothetical protein
MTYIPWLDPENDDGRDPDPLPLYEAINFACRVLKDPSATQWMRQKAIDELRYSYESLGADYE